MTDVERLLILNMVEGVGSVRTQELLRHFLSSEGIFKASEAELGQVKGIGPRIAGNITRGIKEIDIDKEVRSIKKHNVAVRSFLDKDYPANLKDIYDPPMVLYCKGGFQRRDDMAVAIVGSRRASFYGMQTAERLAFELASRGITVVSGLARGIDSSAHKGALRAKGRTIAVLGSGIGYIYPEEHTELAGKVCDAGVLVSEFPMMTIPDRGNFPKRNRVISGLSLGVIVVEAAERSGALITADCALEQGKEVFAVPGKVDSVTSKGANRLIKQGARLAEGVEDVLEELDLGNRVGCQNGNLRGYPEHSVLDKRETLVYNLLTSEPRHMDELAGASGLSVSEISMALVGLELRKFAKQLPGKNFVRC